MRIIAMGAVLLFMTAATAASQEPLEHLDASIERAMREWEIPGLAVAVVKDDRIVYLKAFGVRQVGRPQKVDTETLFPLGSNTKAFTAAAVAMLVDDKKLSWDDPVIRYVPSVRLADDWVSKHVTIRDLLSHRVAGGWGGSSEPLILLTTFRGDEALRRMQEMRGDASGFRARFDYENANFWLAGKVIAAVSGMSWKDFVTARLFGPLQMKSAKTSVRQLWHDRAVASCVECELERHVVSLDDARVGNIVVPHRRATGGPETAPVWPLEDDPGGSIYATVADVAQWLRFQVAKGAVHGKRLVRTDIFEAMHTPQIVVPRAVVQGLGPESGHFWAYGLGWYLTDYRGRTAVLHGGGFTSYMGLLPDEQLGVAVLANMPSNYRQALILTIFDAYLDPPQRDRSKQMLAAAELQRERQRAARQKRDEEEPPAGMAAVDVSPYVGKYQHPFFGTVTVTKEDERLVFRFTGAQEGKLVPWEGHKFRIIWRGPQQYHGLATFDLLDGIATAVTLEYPKATFRRVAD